MGSLVLPSPQSVNATTHTRYREWLTLPASGVYVYGTVHTNTIVGFWSLAKRGIGGVCHSVSKDYLQHYLDEYTLQVQQAGSGELDI